MGYERNDRHGPNDGRYGGSRDGGRGYDRGQGRPSGYDYEDRGFFDRAGDEVRSWFGDEEAERRRRYDERYDQRFEGDTYGRRDDYGYRGDQGRGGQAERGGYGGAGTYDAGRHGGDRYQGGRYASQDRGAQSGWGGDAGRSNDRGRDWNTGSNHDTSYTSWRDRQISAFDTDYADYRRENQSRFESEFSAYRGKRQSQRELIRQVQEHFEVLGSDGQHVGKVDHVRGDRLKLAKNDQNAGGHHHSIPSSWIETVEGDKVTLSKTAEQARQAWRDEDRDDNDRGLFGRSDQDRGERTDWSSDRNLNRSFSGTY